MDDDWQSSALNHRHLHNRGRKTAKGSHSSNSNNINVKKLFGTYTVSCPSAAKLANCGSDSKYEGTLELYCLNEGENAVFAEFILPDALHAGNVVLAGSRKVLADVIRDMEQEEDEDDEQGADEEDDAGVEEVRGNSDNVEVEEDNERDDDAITDSFEEDPVTERRSQGMKFEKNSFRNSKFWVRYQGELLNRDSEDIVEGSGYWIWPGSKTDRFEGTISCPTLAWDNVKMEGWKRKGAGARDYDTVWKR